MTVMFAQLLHLVVTADLWAIFEDESQQQRPAEADSQIDSLCGGQFVADFELNDVVPVGIWRRIKPDAWVPPSTGGPNLGGRSGISQINRARRLLRD